jgi:phospholipid transport system substrate-binding protein
MKLKPFAPLLLLALLIAPLRIAQADDNAPKPAISPRQLAEKLADDCVAVLRDPNLNPDEKTAKIQTLVYAQIDFKTVARLTLANQWRTLTDPQQADFINAYKQHLSRVYANIGRDYKNQTVKFLGDHEVARGDWLVQAEVIGENNDKTKVDYRLRLIDGRWWIIDMMIEGQSMVANFRAQFAEIMRTGGFDQLMKVLKEKNAKAEK